MTQVLFDEIRPREIFSTRIPKVHFARISSNTVTLNARSENSRPGEQLRAYHAISRHEFVPLQITRRARVIQDSCMIVVDVSANISSGSFRNSPLNCFAIVGISNTI